MQFWLSLSHGLSQVGFTKIACQHPSGLIAPMNQLSRISPVFMFWACLLMTLSACTSQPNFELKPIYSNVSWKSEADHRFYSRLHRNGKIYQDYATVMLVDGLLKDQRYREKFVEDLGSSFVLDEQSIAQAKKQQADLNDTRFEALIFFYQQDKNAPELHEEDTLWKVYFIDDDGHLYRPLKLVELEPHHREVVFLKKQLISVDRWVKIYLATFPKLNKKALNQPLGDKPLKILITGLQGKVEMVWKDVEIFY